MGDDLTINKAIFDTVYNIVYAVAAFLATTTAIRIDSKQYSYLTYLRDKVGVLFLLFVLVIVIGFRAYNVGTDTANYYLFNWMMNFPAESKSEILFYSLIDLSKYLSNSFTLFLIIVALLFLWFTYLSFNKIAKIFKANIFWVFFSFFSLFFFKNMGINVIRQGVSLVIFLYAVCCWFEKPVWSFKIIVLGILSFMTHTTSVIPISMFIFCWWVSKKIPLNYFIALYFLGIVLSLLNVGLLNIAPFLQSILGNGGRANYLSGNDTNIYVVGFKPQFVLFNNVFFILFLFLQTKILKKGTEISYRYEIMFKYFIVASFVFFMAFQIPFSDRWGLFGWIVIPILMAPYLTLIKNKITYRTPSVLFFIFIYIFFIVYG